MASFLQFTKPVQIKLHQFSATFTRQFSRPVHRFIQQMVFGILKSGSVQLNSIGRALQEKISLKKVTARLVNHLGKVGLWQQVTSATLKTQAPEPAKMPVCDRRSVRGQQEIREENGRPSRCLCLFDIKFLAIHCNKTRFANVLHL